MTDAYCWAIAAVNPLVYHPAPMIRSAYLTTVPASPGRHHEPGPESTHLPRRPSSAAVYHPLPLKGPRLYPSWRCVRGRRGPGPRRLHSGYGRC